MAKKSIVLLKNENMKSSESQTIKFTLTNKELGFYGTTVKTVGQKF